MREHFIIAINLNKQRKDAITKFIKQITNNQNCTY